MLCMSLPPPRGCNEYVIHIEEVMRVKGIFWSVYRKSITVCIFWCGSWFSLVDDFKEVLAGCLYRDYTVDDLSADVHQKAGKSHLLPILISISHFTIDNFLGHPMGCSVSTCFSRYSIILFIRYLVL